MTLRDKSLVQLRRDEGEVLHVYKDHLGFDTLGIGILVDKRKGGISSEESAMLFNHRFQGKYDEVQRRLPWFATLSEARQGVLLNMAYQMGVQGLLGFPKFLKMVEQGEYLKASKEMLDSKWADQTPERAKRLSKQMETDTWV